MRNNSAAAHSTLLAILATALLAVLLYRPATALPPLPKDFRWAEIDRLKAAFPVPVGWKLVKSQGKLLASFAIYQPGANGGRFDTGLSVSAVDNLARISAQGLNTQLARFARQIDAAPEYRLLSREDVTRNGWRGISLRFDDASRPAVVALQRLYLADEQADRLLIMTFRAPRSQWASAWRVGKIMLEHFLLLPAGL